MALPFADRVRQASATTGLVPFVLEAPAVGDFSFASSFDVDEPIAYAAIGKTSRGLATGELEIGFGHLNAGGELVRDSVTRSSNANNPVDFTSATLSVFSTLSEAALELAIGEAISVAIDALTAADVGADPAGSAAAAFTAAVNAAAASLGAHTALTSGAHGISVFGATLVAVATAAAGRTALGLATIASSGSASDLGAGTVPAARFPAFTGHVTTVAGGVATTIAAGVITDAMVAAANKDGLAAVASMRTIGLGALQAAAGTSIADHVAALDPHLAYQKRLDKIPIAFIKGNIGGANATAHPGIWQVAGTGQFRGFGATFFQAQNRTGFTSTAVAGSTSCGTRSNAYWHGGFGVAGTGGYKMVARFGISDAVLVATGRTRVVMGSQNAQPDVNPYTAVDMAVGIACDGAAGETNFFAFCHTFSTATKVNLGANFPANTTGVDWYECTITRESGASEVTVRLERLNTGDVATATLSGVDLPPVTQPMAVNIARSNGGTAAAVGIDFDHVYVRGGPNP